MMDQKQTTENVLVSEKLPVFEEALLGEDGSCTSSLGTSVSEVEDLFLGAEAHSFEKKKKLNKIEILRKTVDQMRKLKSASNKILILKKSCTSLGEANSMCQLKVSALKSVQDVIAAREFDPCTVLVNLGFGYCNSNIERNEILRRFKGSDNLMKNADGSAVIPQKKSTSEENTTIENKKDSVISAVINTRVVTPSHSFENDAKGIYKTREWLNNQLPTTPEPLTPADGKSTTMAYEAAAAKKAPTTITSNLHRLAKKRNRFSKSRQSSFDIMPELEEEDDIVSSTAHPSQDHDASTLISTFHSTSTFSKPNERISPVQVEERDKSPTVRNSSHLVNQKESFELEEINSNEDVTDSRHFSPSRRLQENLQTAIHQRQEGEEQQPSLIDSSSRLTQGQKEDHLLLHEDDDEDDEENESSSGFDEDEISQHVKMCEDDDSKANVILRSVVETIETACCPHMTHHSQHVEYVVDESTTICQQQDEKQTCANTNNNNGKFQANYVLLHGKKPSQLSRNKQPTLVRLKSASRRLLVNKQQVDRECLLRKTSQTSSSHPSVLHDKDQHLVDEIIAPNT